MFNQQANCKNIIQIKDSLTEYKLPKFKEVLEVLEDQKKEWTFEQVSSPSFENKFKHNSEPFPLIKNYGSSYWGKINLENISDPNSEWVIEFPDQSIDYLEIYIPDSTIGYIKCICGDNMKFINRTYNHKNCVFKIPKIKNQLQTYYFRVESKSPGTYVFWIRSAKYFKKYALNEYLLLGMFYGIILITIIFNSSLYIYLRDRAYLYYSLYVISIGLFSLFQNGIGFQYIWPDIPELNNNGKSFAICALVVWQLMYTRAFLRIEQHAPLIGKIIICFIFIRVLIFLFGYFYTEPVFSFLPIDNIPLLLSFIAGILAYKNGYKPARFFLLGFSMSFLGFIITSIINLGLIANTITVYAHDIGSCLEMVFLSLAFADRLRVEKSDKEIIQLKVLEELSHNAELKNKIMLQLKENEEVKDNINKELEAKVQERTEEIKSVNNKLIEQKKEISSINSILKSYNSNLKANVFEIEKERVTHKEIKLNDFILTYPDNSACNRYLYELKWGESFQCRKCNYSKGIEGAELFSMRCLKCNYVESITAHTLFHRLKFPIQQAFQILFILTTSKQKIPLDDIVEMTGTKRTSCYVLKKKIEERIEHLKPRYKKEEISWKTIILNDE